MDLKGQRIAVVGAGPVGCLLSVLLGRRGAEVTLYEKRADLRAAPPQAGRSINLVLTERGLSALAMIRERERVVRELTVPVLGRMMHDLDGELTYQPYGKDDSEHNHSISRAQLNAYLLDEVEEAGITIRFEHALTEVDLATTTLRFEVGAGGDFERAEPDVIIGCDGAPSAVRGALMELAGYQEQVEMLEDGYKEIPFAAGPDGEYAMASHALHIWPRGEQMLMGLANLDGSFTGTIYMPLEGEHSFESLRTEAKVEAFFERFYPDAIGLVPELGRTFLEHPLGTLGTVRCGPWHRGGEVLLVGDAAHAIVPFFGQGLNSGFEDCSVLDEILSQSSTLSEAFEAFYRARKPNTDAIAEMALENYVEMSEHVSDETFLLRKRLERRIEQELGHLYRSRYATIMYSHVPYRDALEAGLLQRDLLKALVAEGASSPEALDLEHVERLIGERLTPFYRARGIDIASALKPRS